MIKKAMLIISMSISVFMATGQNRYFTKNGTVSFEAGTALEDIKAVNKSASSVFDKTTGQIEFAVLIKGFEFRRALMQEHFNENYMESDKYPKAVFKGTIVNINTVDFNTSKMYPVTVKGTLEIHGVKKEITINSSLKPSGSSVSASAKFDVLLSDYNISIPSLVKDKISKNVTVSVSTLYNPL